MINLDACQYEGVYSEGTPFLLPCFQEKVAQYVFFIPIFI